ncbi:hypothetical protein CSPX01_12310 [Colletotrichum filicis]|nr:hypothetical protein CSPX01_12310 [Colletotrichum filicis]
MSSTDSVHNGSTSGKPSHQHTSAEWSHALSKPQILDYTESSVTSNVYHINSQGTDAETSKVYHQTKAAETLADFDKQFNSHPPRSS